MCLLCQSPVFKLVLVLVLAYLQSRGKRLLRCFRNSFKICKAKSNIRIRFRMINSKRYFQWAKRSTSWRTHQSKQTSQYFRIFLSIFWHKVAPESARRLLSTINSSNSMTLFIVQGNLLKNIVKSWPSIKAIPKESEAMGENPLIIREILLTAEIN